MKNRLFLSILLQFTIAPPAVLAQTSAFTYQGCLLDGGWPANGSYDLRFTLADAATNGNHLAGTLTNTPVLVSNGLFAVTMDFGAGAFTGEARWLEIGVRTNGSLDHFILLSPRQPLTATPYALYTPTAAKAASLSGTLPAAQLTGTVPLAQLPAVVLTNSAAGITLNGSFSGNGSGLNSVAMAGESGLTDSAGAASISVDLSLVNQPIRVLSLSQDATFSVGGAVAGKARFASVYIWPGAANRRLLLSTNWALWGCAGTNTALSNRWTALHFMSVGTDATNIHVKLEEQ